jgi:hypothetical protein
MFKIAIEADADIAYLSSAIVREALKLKFKKMFGRDPVAVDVNDPLVVKDTRVPDMVASSIDSEIATILKASAIESAKNVEGIPQPDNATFLYKILDDTSASVSLEALKEYQDIEDTAREATVSNLSGEGSGITIENGMANVVDDRANIDIGIFIDNTLFAEEFQYNLAQAGGEALDPKEKETVFNNIFNLLPGDANQKDASVRENLLKVVGLTLSK